MSDYTVSTYDRHTRKGFPKFVCVGEPDFVKRFESGKEASDWLIAEEEKPKTFFIPWDEPKSESVLQEAHRIINGERAQTYGDSVYNDFKTIGELWSVAINSRHGTSVDVSSDDVAMMMLLLKVARSIKNTSHRDSLVDIAGYAGCAAKLRGIDQ